MNESAILHIPDSQYCFAVGEKKLVIRLRMAKEDADASVTLIYAGKYQFQANQRADSGGDTLYGPALSLL